MVIISATIENGMSMSTHGIQHGNKRVCIVRGPNMHPIRITLKLNMNRVYKCSVFFSLLINNNRPIKVTKSVAVADKCKSINVCMNNGLFHGNIYTETRQQTY